MNRIFAVLTIACVVIVGFSSFQNKIISGFHLQLEVTKEATNYLKSLENEEKSDWLKNIPDSIPLQTSCVLELNTIDSVVVHFKIGSVDGYSDIFEGEYDMISKSSLKGINHKSSRNIHHFYLGELRTLKSYTAIVWVTNVHGKVLDMNKISK